MRFAFKNCADVRTAKYTAHPVPILILLPSVTHLFSMCLIYNDLFFLFLQYLIIGNIHLNDSTHYLV